MSLSFPFRHSLWPWQEIYNRPKSHLVWSTVRSASDQWFALMLMLHFSLIATQMRRMSPPLDSGTGEKKSFTDFFISYKATIFRNARWAADAHEFIPYLLGELALVPQWIALGESMCQCHIVQHNASRNYILQTFLPDVVSRHCLLAFSHCCSIWWSTSVHFFFAEGQLPRW